MNTYALFAQVSDHVNRPGMDYCMPGPRKTKYIQL